LGLQYDGTGKIYRSAALLDAPRINPETAVADPRGDEPQMNL
jgi:hypothetical protein